MWCEVASGAPRRSGDSGFQVGETSGITADRPAGRVYWITGLSGAGKSTLAGLLTAALRTAGRWAVQVDGDAVREMLLESPGHDRASRLRIAQTYGRMCRFLSLQGLDVVCPTISMFHDIQAWNRTNIPNYFEIFLDLPFDLLQQRDNKNIYRRALAGELRNVVGVDIDPEFPLRPDIKFGPNDMAEPSSMVAYILSHVLRAARGETPTV